MVEARSVSSLETYQYRWNIAPLAMLCMCGRAQSDPILRTCTGCFISALRGRGIARATAVHERVSMWLDTGACDDRRPKVVRR